MRAERRGAGLLAAGALLLAAIVVPVLLAPLVSGHDPVHQYDWEGAARLPPGSRVWLLELADGRSWAARRLAIDGEKVRVERAGRIEVLAAREILNIADGSPPPRLFFPLGTDRYGRDCWSRLLAGGRISLQVAALAALLAALVGVAVGALAAGGGAAVDFAVMRGVDALMAFPRLFLILALAAFLEPGQTLVVVLLGATGWMRVSRLARAEFATLRGLDFVVAARGTGQRPVTILGRHLLPNALGPILVATVLRAGDVILVEAALSYLGLGVQPPAPSWGNMIADGRPDLLGAWWVSVFPGLAIVSTVVALNLVGDGLRDRRAVGS